jgi:hypothetical protein
MAWRTGNIDPKPTFLILRRNGRTPRIVFEKLRLKEVPVADSLLLAQEIRPLMGERRVMQEALL